MTDAVPHPIEVESYRRLRAEVDTADLPALVRAVVERAVHATGEPVWAEDLVADEVALAAGRAALLAGAPVVADVRMVAAGLTSLPMVHVALDHAPAVAPPGDTRTAAGMRAALRHLTSRPDAPAPVVVVGCAPTALEALIDHVAAGGRPPALVVGTPVGYVGAAESKQRLRETGLPAVSNRSRRGGAAVASAIVNALRMHPRHVPDHSPDPSEES